MFQLLGSLCCKCGYFFSLQNPQEKAALHLEIIDVLLWSKVKLTCGSSVWRESIAETCTKSANISLVINGRCCRRQSSCTLSVVYGNFLLQQVVLHVKMRTDISRNPMCYGLAFTGCTPSAALRIRFYCLLSIFLFVIHSSCNVIHF